MFSSAEEIIRSRSGNTSVTTGIPEVTVQLKVVVTSSADSSSLSSTVTVTTYGISEAASREMVPLITPVTASITAPAGAPVIE